MPEPPRPSGTVVVLRDAASGLEVLLLERNTREGGRGASVFPGGRVEGPDRVDEPDGFLESARRAAVREAREEAGLELEPGALLPISRWITPDLTPKRFDTWFFAVAVAPGSRITVDGSEIRSHSWLAPGDALAGHDRRTIRLAPPTFVTLTWLAGYADSKRALDGLGQEPLVTFRPRIERVPEGACILYPGDAGYDSGAIDAPGPRHRLWSAGHSWRYERS